MGVDEESCKRAVHARAFFTTRLYLRGWVTVHSINGPICTVKGFKDLQGLIYLGL